MGDGQKLLRHQSRHVLALLVERFVEGAGVGELLSVVRRDEGSSSICTGCFDSHESRLAGDNNPKKSRKKE